VTYRLTIAAVGLASTLAGVALGLAAVPMLKRIILTDRRPIEWEGLD
jgi:hypothetical protein